MTNRSILNAAPAIVAWGLARGLLSLKPAPEPDYLAKYRTQQRRAAQRGMRKLRAERAETRNPYQNPGYGATGQ